MKISASLVKELREMTGVGMMDCKKALEKTNGDIELAVEEMRKSGQAKAAKKASRVASEGAVIIKSSIGPSLIIEINTETDFVARDDNFVAFADKVSLAALEANEQDVAVISKLSLDSGTVEEARLELIAKIGENISLRRAALVEGDNIGSYNHGGRIGVLVALKGGDESLAKDIAMHVAASKPLVIAPEDMPKDLCEKEKEIFTAQAEASGKPQNVIEKMIEGRLQKFMKENSLLEQPFVKNPDQSVRDLLKDQNATVTNLVRYELGEGIEKQEADFVGEVMAQVKEAA